MSYCIKKTTKAIEFKELKDNSKSQSEVMEWCGGKKGLDGGILLRTPESDGEYQRAACGDFILKGYTDELGWHFWPVKASYFRENYDVVPEQGGNP